MEFVHLHTHTEYSLLQSTARISELIKKAAAQHMKALALTDKDVMYGVVPFYKQCTEAGIKPIIGLELWVEGVESAGSYPVLLLAETNKGYRALLQLSTIKQTEHVISMQKTLDVLEDCTLIFPYADSEAAELLRYGEEEKALHVLSAWQEAAGRHSIYLERQPANEEEVIQLWKKTANRLSLSLVAGNNVHSVNKDEKEARQALTAIDAGNSLQQIKSTEIDKTGTFVDAAEMEECLAEDQEAVRQTVYIAQTCEVTLDFGQMLLPNYPISSNMTAKQVLRERCEQGVICRFGKWDDAVKERLDHELHIIHRMGFDDYFLIVADFVEYARNAGMLVGPGRGSAAGSLVSYVLEITDVDPLKHDLLFERFLNPERVNMPDIDIDFPDYRRDEVIEYVADKYGKDKVAQIVTFGTFGARAAIRDVGRILEAPQALIDRIASFVSQGLTLKKAFEENSALQDLVEKEELAKAVLKLASKIEGLPRHTSVHAAGVVMSADHLYKHVPLMKKDDGLSLTQFSMEGLEDIGLLKIDFLGLKNLSLLERITSSIRFKERQTIDLRNLALDDSLTYDMLARGDTTGVFQLESAGMRSALQQIKPTTFEDIAAVNALYRPDQWRIYRYMQKENTKK
ncbi:DNA polymerase III subunit alpha [Salibacterium salarium]|uniref:DNA polymerase III subunit alpha n=1 Tax=Salibacterium salarium TaxID=284579 RepID=A0A428N3V8_9BACI|nr:DNA polymerase III subunit alpha [Salibacterium salarium]RSL32957.1 DNA polymerase III subunit alpha [Salibacterium salarium]